MTGNVKRVKGDFWGDQDTLMVREEKKTTKNTKVTKKGSEPGIETEIMEHKAGFLA